MLYSVEQQTMGINQLRKHRIRKVRRQDQVLFVPESHLQQSKVNDYENDLLDFDLSNEFIKDREY